jgi:hypothetical protein
VIGRHLDSTLWRGSAFDCARMGDEINLLHSLYTVNSLGTRASGDCNNGSIVAQILGVKKDNTYVSQLNVTVSDNVIGNTIECNYFNTTTTTVMRVGEETLHIEGMIILLMS